MKIIILLLFCLCSCGVYNSHFECAPGKGVGCASVGEVLDMIVEKEEGEDLFVKNKGRVVVSEKSKKERSKEEKLMVMQSDGELILVPAKESTQ